MADASEKPKSKEQLEREWWDAWWAEDYSWEGLSEKSLPGRGGRFGETTLQDYWRSNAETGEIRDDDQLILSGDLVEAPDGSLWHIVHMPMAWDTGIPTWKAELSDVRWSEVDLLVQSKLREILAAAQAEPAPADLENEADFYLDGLDDDIRAMLCGTVLKKLPTAHNESSSRISANFSQSAFVGPVFANSCAFESVTFDKCLFASDAEFARTKFGFSSFVDATFLGYARFNGATFSSETEFDRARFVSGAWFAGAQFNEVASFRSAIFEGSTAFSHGKFVGPASFQGASFSAYSTFGCASFAELAKFSDATFAAGVRFDEADFWHDAAFDGVKFFGDTSFFRALFSAQAIFDRAEIAGVSRFGAVKFLGDAGFAGTSFFDDASFTRSEFSRKAWFASATFKKGAYYFGSLLKGDSSFESVLFNGNAVFGSLAIGAAASLSFEGAKFQRQADFRKSDFRGRVNFDAVDFSHASLFDGMRLNKFSFTGTRFSQRARFRRVQFREVELTAIRLQLGFWLPAAFLSVLLVIAGWYLPSSAMYVLVVLSICFALAWVNLAPSLLQLPDEEFFRERRKEFEESRNRQSELEMHAWELKCARFAPAHSVIDASVTRPLEKLLSVSYDVFSRYGRSVVRPLVVLLLSTVLFSVIYWVIEGGAERGRWERIISLSSSVDQTFLEATHYSLSRVIPLDVWTQGESEKNLPSSIDAAHNNRIADCNFRNRLLAAGDCRPSGVPALVESGLGAHRIALAALSTLQTAFAAALYFLLALALRRKFQIS